MAVPIEVDIITPRSSRKCNNLPSDVLDASVNAIITQYISIDKVTSMVQNKLQAALESKIAAPTLSTDSTMIKRERVASPIIKNTALIDLTISSDPMEPEEPENLESHVSNEDGCSSAILEVSSGTFGTGVMVGMVDQDRDLRCDLDSFYTKKCMCKII